MTMIIGGVALQNVCPGAEFETNHMVLSRPNGQLVISRDELREPNRIYVHVGVKSGGVIEEGDYIECQYYIGMLEDKAVVGKAIDELVASFEKLAK